MHHATRAHTRELCPNDQTLQLLFTAFASEGNYQKNRRTFFLTSSLIFEISISGGTPKDSGIYFRPYIHGILFFSKKCFCPTGNLGV